MRKLFVASVMMLMSAGTAWAQDSDGDGIDDEFDPDYTPAGGGDTTTTGGGGDTTMASAGGGAGGAPTMGLEVSFNSASGIPVGHILYGLSESAFIDAFLGVDFVNQSMGDMSESAFGLTIGGGYRMYQDAMGRVRPYLEPYLLFSLSTDEAAGEPKSFALGAAFGADVMIVEQFTLGARIGAELGYETTSADTSTFAFGLYTTSLNATIWW